MSRIRQHVYFAIRSETISADELSQKLGVAPDLADVRASKSAQPPRPAAHSWNLICDEKGLRVDEQVEAVLGRLRPIEQSLIDVTAGPSCTAVLQIVRYLDAEDDELEALSPPGSRLQKLAGQHQLLGWHLDVDTLAFLARVGASIDADEYG